jgi:hypothetical protein
MLGLIAPAGNQIQTQAIDVSKLDDFARLDIVSDEHAPVIVLAPQLRNLFGLYTSFRESSALLDEVIHSDPQRFYDLQRLDEVNQAISALAQGLDQVVLNRNPAEGISAARAMAQKFGVSQVDPECFRNNAVNTQCVAVSIVANKDFVLPSSSELGMLSNGKGNIKTAYVYVPAWLKGSTPALSASSQRPICLTQGRFEVATTDRMPVVNHWHHWRMAFSDSATGAPLGEASQVSLASERSLFSFSGGPAVAQGPWVNATLQGQFGFEPVSLPPVQLVLPPQEAQSLLDGAAPLVAGESMALQLRAPQSACVQGMSLSRAGAVIARSDSGSPDRLRLDLSRVPPGPVELRLDLHGGVSQTVSLRVLPPRALVKSVEHTDLEEQLIVTGERLERIARVQMGSIACSPLRTEQSSDGRERLLLTCDADIRRNASLPTSLVLHHQQDEPAPMQLSLRKNAASPRVRLAPSPNALVMRPSAKARRWGLDSVTPWLSDDSGLNLLLQAVDGYTLTKGSYSLQLRYVDDPVSARTPISVPLMTDLGHQELRTRQAVPLKGTELPSVINPLEYRVVQDSTGLASAWAPLQRSVLMLPELGSLACAATPGHWWLHGSQLHLVDAAGWAESELTPAQLQPCPNGLCLLLPQTNTPTPLTLRLHWVREPVFTVEVGPGPSCPAP